MRITQSEYSEILRRQAMRLANHVPIKSGRIEQQPRSLNDLKAFEIIKANIVTAPSTDEAKLNKTERSYLGYLRAQRHPFIGIQNIALKLADDTRYNCDFWIVTNDGKLQAHEVKGFWRDDAKVKIKVAARLFPFVDFVVVMKVKNGWTLEPVKP